MQYSKVWNMASGVDLHTCKPVRVSGARLPLINTRGLVYPQLTLYGFIFVVIYSEVKHNFHILRPNVQPYSTLKRKYNVIYMYIP